jgi:hypothetical protein
MKWRRCQVVSVSAGQTERSRIEYHVFGHRSVLPLELRPVRPHLIDSAHPFLVGGIAGVIRDQCGSANRTLGPTLYTPLPIQHTYPAAVIVIGFLEEVARPVGPQVAGGG